MNEKMRLNFVDDSDPALISKRFWSHVKSKSKSTRIPESIRYGSRFRNDPKDQANLFNEYFYDQFSEASDYNVDIGPSNHNFFDLKFSSDDVYFILKKLNASKAAGPDGIHGKVLKSCAGSLAYPLSILFNLSFVTGCIPPDWKLASVVPVFKKDDKNSVENYRPISLTSLVMKVFERCVKTALFSVCEEVLDPRQHGFLNNRSCVTQMIPFVHDLALTLDEKSRSDIIYFDFSKAFDSVSHDLILKKLKENFKIGGLMLQFIKNYLEGRMQQVVVGGHTSSVLPVKSGVPQGSILGPLLFVLFINDMFSCVSSETNITLYADDTKIWRRITMFSDHFILQNDINNLYDWSVRNKMVFHPKKCKAVSITLQRNVLDNLPFNIFIYESNGTLIDYEKSQKDLGVVINPNLTWGPHYVMLLSQASSNL
ncbi:MAG: reverse transcriptase family protein, partial [Cytophagales bacterium]|nr:reverse transcriptase family protein [Cytophagales bacterium]